MPLSHNGVNSFYAYNADGKRIKKICKGIEMNNFSGIVNRIYICGVVLSAGITWILFEKPWKKGFKPKKCIPGMAVIAFAVCLGLIYAHRIIVPDVSVCTGEFIGARRNSHITAFTYEYVFDNGEDKKYVFCLDTFSKKKIFPSDFEYGKKYTIYFDELTKIIVRVEVVDSA